MTLEECGAIEVLPAQSRYAVPWDSRWQLLATLQKDHHAIDIRSITFQLLDTYDPNTPHFAELPSLPRDKWGLVTVTFSHPRLSVPPIAKAEGKEAT